MREDCIVKGEVSDSWVYGLLRNDAGMPNRAGSTWLQQTSAR